MSELINNQSKQKQAALKSLIKRLHEGESFETVKQDFEASFQDVTTEEITQMEAALVEEGMPVEEIQRLCDVHAKVFGGSVSDIHGGPDLTEEKGHPLEVLKTENDRLEQLISEEIMPYLEQEGNQALLMLRVGLDRLMDVKVHYNRKEQLFFPYLEKKGITTPPKVMWGVDDEIRDKLNALKARLSEVDVTVPLIKDELLSVIHDVQEMVFKENHILIPLLKEKLNLVNFIDIADASDEMGYVLDVKPAQSFRGGVASKKEDDNVLKDDQVVFDAGSLSVETVNAMLNTLPLDMTFVDKDGHVRYFTQGKERIFDRPKTILGRHVNMCHPPSSVDVVEKIVNNFKSGKKDHEDFWINMRGRMIHIRYFAVRNKQGEYLGTLEMTQDITGIKALEGEKRLMDDVD